MSPRGARELGDDDESAPEAAPDGVASGPLLRLAKCAAAYASRDTVKESRARGENAAAERDRNDRLVPHAVGRERREDSVLHLGGWPLDGWPLDG